MREIGFDVNIETWLFFCARWGGMLAAMESGDMVIFVEGMGMDG